MVQLRQTPGRAQPLGLAGSAGSEKGSGHSRKGWQATGKAASTAEHTGSAAGQQQATKWHAQPVPVMGGRPADSQPDRRLLGQGGGNMPQGDSFRTREREEGGHPATGIYCNAPTEYQSVHCTCLQHRLSPNPQKIRCESATPALYRQRSGFRDRSAQGHMASTSQTRLKPHHLPNPQAHGHFTDAGGPSAGSKWERAGPLLSPKHASKAGNLRS